MTDTPGPGPIRVLIADDRRVVRDGLSMLVGLTGGVTVVGTACDRAGAVRLAEAHRPDVVLVDLRMPGTDGIAATADLRQRLPACAVPARRSCSSVSSTCSWSECSAGWCSWCGRTPRRMRRS